MRQYLSHQARSLRSWLLRETKSEVRSFQELQWLTQHLDRPIPFTIMGIQPVTMAWLINDLRINRRKMIVELGTGSSTQLIAKCIELCFPPEERPAFITIEEDANWQDIVRGYLREDGTSELVEFVHAPRTTYESGRKWYDKDAIVSVLDGRKVDSLLVDGPSLVYHSDKTHRQEALDFFQPDKMDDNSIVFIDDIHRPAERKMLTQWSDREKIRYKTLNGYIGVIVKGDHYISKPA